MLSSSATRPRPRSFSATTPGALAALFVTTHHGRDCATSVIASMAYGTGADPRYKTPSASTMKPSKASMKVPGAVMLTPTRAIRDHPTGSPRKRRR